jgi:hypothetical protein
MKQTFEIPEGCNRVTIEQHDNQIITTFEPEFKDGDVLFVEENMHHLSAIFIFKKYIGNNSSEAHIAIVDGKLVYAGGDVLGLPRHATEEEKQKLFDAMAKDGKRWNAEAKQVEDIKPKRWRAKMGSNYWFLDASTNPVCENDYLSVDDNSRYYSGNYFKTEEQAEAAAKIIEELLKQINP